MSRGWRPAPAWGRLLRRPSQGPSHRAPIGGQPRTSPTPARPEMPRSPKTHLYPDPQPEIERTNKEHARKPAMPTPTAAPGHTHATPPTGRDTANLANAPRCGARTRRGCPCQAPAVRGKLRCRMHGGGSTGPRTPDGLARLRAARTTHGGYTAEARAFQRHVITTLRRNRTYLAATQHAARLPPEMAAQLLSQPPELDLPAYPSTGLTPAEDRAILRAEREALEPWRQAIAAARQAGQPSGNSQRHAPPCVQKPHAPEPQAAAVPTAAPAAQAKPHAPEPQTAAVPTPASAAQAKPHAPEPQAAAVPTAAPAAQAKPHAPEPQAAAVPTTAPAPQSEPHAPEPQAAAVPTPASAAQAKPHAPEPQSAAVPAAASAAQARPHAPEPQSAAVPAPASAAQSEPHAPEPQAAAVPAEQSEPDTPDRGAAAASAEPGKPHAPGLDTKPAASQPRGRDPHSTGLPPSRTGIPAQPRAALDRSAEPRTQDNAAPASAKPHAPAPARPQAALGCKCQQDPIRQNRPSEPRRQPQPPANGNN
jgi:hypothetical protein